MLLPPASGHVAEVEVEVAFLDQEGLAVMEVQELAVVEVEMRLSVLQVQKWAKTKSQIPEIEKC